MDQSTLKDMLMKLAGKIAIVTGAGRGIGRVTALALAQEGAHLVLAARTVSELEVVAEEIRSVGREALAVATDVAKKVDVDAMVQQTLKRFGKVDILV
ncbi:MAG: SDR family NAD(P)-dependent oxidoreductase, partial [SAR324 cluster bacterium]|nr:SDR family NAD(P)-dependent oxidoreductase [SAR324 cluster bacterium]